MMKTRIWVNIFLFVLFSLIVGGCREQKSRKPSPDWSRGIPLGYSVQGSVGMAVERGGDLVHMAWPETADAGLAIHYMQLDETAVPVVDRLLDVSSGELRTPRLAPAANGAAHLFWGGRPPGQRAWELWHVLLDREGKRASDASRLSAADAGVGAYAIAPDGSGGVFVTWEDDSVVELYALHLTVAGAVQSGPILVASDAESPTMQVDEAGTLHLLWRNGSQVLYTILPGGELNTAEGTQVADLRLSASDVLAGPVLGLTDDHAYILWSILSRSGLEAGSAHTEYAAFPLDSPGLSGSARLRLQTDENLPYEDYQGTHQLTLLAPPGSVSGSSDYVHRPESASGIGSELAVAVETYQQYRLQTYSQVAVLLFDEGTFKGYEMAAKTESFSRDAILDVDAAGSLHLAWREGGQGGTIYYATTAPAAREALDRLSREDLISTAFTGGMESLVGIMFFPVAFIWLLPGLGLMGLWKLHIGDDELTNPITVLLFIIAVVMYEVIKILFLPTITAYVPFSAWMDVPNNWRQPLLIGVPVLIFIIASLVAFLVYKRSETKSGLLVFFALAAVDAILSLAIYGVNFLGVF